MSYSIMHLTTGLLILFCHVSASSNPFKGRNLYVVPKFRSAVLNTYFNSAPADRRLLMPMAKVSTAFWISRIADASRNSPHNTGKLLGILNNAKKKKGKQTVTIVVYNLPNRDCASRASKGEICCSPNCDYKAGPSDCSSGLSKYKTKFIDVIAKTISSFCGSVKVAVLLEPDAIPNLVTNSNNPRCGKTTRTAYLKGVQYAIKKLDKTCFSTSVYLDAANGAWLGWRHNAAGFANIIKQLKVAPHLRGFVTNIANYQPLGKRCPSIGICNGRSKYDSSRHPCCNFDSCDLMSQYNSGFTELNYIETLAHHLKIAMPYFNPKFIVDTGRNGVVNSRKDCANWCNVRGAGIGKKPTTKTGHRLIDAYLWVKPPIDSDGCTFMLPNGVKCPRFDHMCESEDSIGWRRSEPRAPEAGSSFQYKFRMLVRNGHRSKSN